MLWLLDRLGPHLRQSGADPSAREAAADLVRYFEHTAPQHHRAEEIHLVPLLQSRGDPAGSRLAARLLREHVLLRSRWVAARGALQAVAAGTLQQFTPSDEGSFEAMASLYRDHMRTEERLACPALAWALPPSALRATSATGAETAPGRQHAVAA